MNYCSRWSELATAFELHDEEMTSEVIERGNIEVTCVQLQVDERRAPKLEDHVGHNPESVTSFEGFTIYRRPRAMR